MNSDERGLLEAIRADLDDDTPRLIYADWLDDNGRPEHAELIRLQLAGGALPRETELIESLKWTWPGGLLRVVGYRRGMGATDWRSLGAYEQGVACLAKAGDPPWVVQRDLRLMNQPDEVIEDLTQSPNFAQLTGLWLARAGITSRA